MPPWGVTLKGTGKVIRKVSPRDICEKIQRMIQRMTRQSDKEGSSVFKIRANRKYDSY